MMYVLKRNQPDWLQFQLSSVCGTATLRSVHDRDREISVPVASLLATSSLMRSIMSDLHPALQSPFIISCACSAEILIIAGELLDKGLVMVKDDRLLHEVQEMLELLGVEVVLSCVKIKQDLVPNDAAVDVLKGIMDHDETSVGGGNIDEVKFEIIVKLEDTVDEMKEVKEMEGNEKFKCPRCNFCCDNSFHLKEHLRGHAEDKPNKHKARHVSPVKKSKKSKRQIKRRKNLIEHIGTEKKATNGKYCIRKLDCPQCNYSTDRHAHLLEHVLIHAVDKPFKCTVCDYSAARNRSLKEHMRQHTGEKPFKCSNCDYSTARNRSLTQHMIQHTGEKPFKCSNCDYSAASTNALKGHMMRKHQVEKA